MGWGELADVLCDVRTGALVRKEAERLLRLRCGELAVGARVTLARRPSRAIVAMLRDDAESLVLEALAGNPRTTGADIAKILARSDAPPRFLAHVAASPWSVRRDVLQAVARHAHTPHAVALGIVHALSVDELRTVARDPATPRLVRTASERRLRA